MSKLDERRRTFQVFSKNRDFQTRDLGRAAGTNRQAPKKVKLENWKFANWEFEEKWTGLKNKL